MNLLTIKGVGHRSDGKLVGFVTFTDVVRMQPVMIKTIKEFVKNCKIPRGISKAVRYYIT